MKIKNKNLVWIRSCIQYHMLFSVRNDNRYICSCGPNFKRHVKRRISIYVYNNKRKTSTGPNFYFWGYHYNYIWDHMAYAYRPDTMYIIFLPALTKWRFQRETEETRDKYIIYRTWKRPLPLAHYRVKSRLYYYFVFIFYRKTTKTTAGCTTAFTK